MSELIATTAQEIVRNEKDCDYMDELFGGVKMPPTQIYLKSEADKVIAHHKYKRCLDKAELCEARYDEEDARVNGRGASWDYISNKMKYWERWRWRWEALAEKFKEAK